MELFTIKMEEIYNKLKTSNIKEVSRATGIPYDRMYKWTKGLSKPKTEDFNILVEYFKNGYSSAGAVEVRGHSGTIYTSSANKRNDKSLIPFYNADFIAGNAELYYDDDTIYPEYYMDVPEFSGCTAFRAYSDSMETRIKSGNILFGTKQEDWKEHLEYGQIFGITCLSGIRYLKYIRKYDADEEHYFLLKSENKNYDDFKIAKSKIKNIWLINGWIDKRT